MLNSLLTMKIREEYTKEDVFTECVQPSLTGKKRRKTCGKGRVTLWVKYLGTLSSVLTNSEWRNILTILICWLLRWPLLISIVRYVKELRNQEALNPYFVNHHSWHSAVCFILFLKNIIEQISLVGAWCRFIMANDVFESIFQFYQQFENHIKMDVLLDLLLSVSHWTSIHFQL